MYEKTKCKRVRQVKIVTLAAILALWILSSLAWAEPVRVGGKRLDEIPDIMMQTAGTRTFRKHAIIRPFWYRPNRTSDEGSSLRTDFINVDSVNGAVRKDPSFVTVYNHPPRDSEGTSGMHPAVSTKAMTDGRSYRVVLPDFSHRGGDRRYYTYTMYADQNGNQHASAIKEMTTSVPAGNVYPIDATAGLFVGGERDESFVVARMTVHDGGNKHLGSDTRYDFYLEFLDGKKLASGAAGSNPTALSHSAGYAYARYPAIRVAAGDFDHDGIASEVAYISPGTGDNYYFEILKVSRSGDSFRTERLYGQNVGRRDSHGKNIEGCDIAAGDFNGDGKEEIALVYNDHGSDKSGYATVQIFYREGSSFRSKYNYVRDGAHRLGGTNPSVLNAYETFYGLIADAGDLDGDSRDEIVYIATLYGDFFQQGRLLFSAWRADDSFNPHELTLQRAPWGVPSLYVDKRMSMSPFLLRSFSAILSPVTANMGGKGAACADLVLSNISLCYSKGAHSPPHIVDDWLFLFKSKHRADGSFSGFDIGTKAIASSGHRIWGEAVLTADFGAESLVLGEPTHMAVRDKKTYASIMQAPAYHVDYIPVPWAADATKPALTNFSYVGGTTTYTKGSTESKTRDIAFNATEFSERGLNIGLSAGGTIKKLAGFSFGADASSGWQRSTSQSLSRTNQSQATVEMTTSSSTDASDNLSFYKADFHIWRYPVIEPAPRNLFGTPSGGSISGTEDGTHYFTYTMTDEPRFVTGSAGQSAQFDNYNPIHEEGNLFSYPTKIEDIPGYADKQTDLSLEDQKTWGGAFTESLMFSSYLNNITSVKTVAKNARNRSLSFNLGWPKILTGSLSLSHAFGNEIGDTSTFTKSYQSSEQVKVNLPTPMLGFSPNYAAHLLKMRAYSDAAGVMNMAFAVDLADNPNAWLWRSSSGSVYAAKPDPALVLPAKFDRKIDMSSGSDLPTWTPNIDERSATQIRGIWFYDSETQEDSSPSLIKGRKYEISFAVYNASFINAGSVPVEVGYQEKNGTKHRIGTYSVNLGGWKQDTENNKATVKFNWTPPTSLKEGDYDFYFQIDPDNRIDEIHENWNTTTGDPKYDPAGNNMGRYPFSVLDKAPSNVVTSASGVGAAEAPTLASFEVTIDGMSPADFMKSLADRSEDFRAHASLTYSGDEPLHNAYVEVVDLAGENGAHHLIANRAAAAIFPGDSEAFSFMVSPSKLKNARLAVTLYADNATLTTEEPASGGGDGAGCDTGAYTFALAAALACLLTATRKPRGRKRP